MAKEIQNQINNALLMGNRDDDCATHRAEIKLEIKDYYILLNLHKALLEAKFHLEPDNVLVCSSPIIANLCDEIVEKQHRKK